MRVARAFRLPIIADHDRARSVGLHAHDRSCRGRSRKAISIPWPMASPTCPPPRAVAMDSGGGAISALRAAFASSPLPSHPSSSPHQVVYAAPMPVRGTGAAYDAAYHLDAGDKLRVVVYGQEGLTNTYAIDAGGSITMPLIGSVPARGRTPAGLASRDRRQTAQRLHPRSLGGGRDRILPAVLHPRRGRGPRPISLRAQHERRKRGRDRRRLLAARPARPRHADPHRCLGIDAARGAARVLRSVPAIPCSSASAGSRISHTVIPGRCNASNLRCAIAHRESRIPGSRRAPE